MGKNVIRVIKKVGKNKFIVDANNPSNIDTLEKELGRILKMFVPRMIDEAINLLLEESNDEEEKKLD